MRAITRAGTLITLTVALALVLTACDGTDENNGADREGVTATFVAVDIGYSEAPQQLATGNVTVELVNEGNLPHNVTIEGLDDGPVVSAGGGETVTADVTLEPGEYVAFCSVEGHRAAGMEATFTIDG